MLAETKGFVGVLILDVWNTVGSLSELSEMVS